jgi:hypothetical protein
VPEDKAQENFTDPDSRIMKRAGVDAVQANLGQAPAQALADTGYRAEAVFERLVSARTFCRPNS